MTSPSLDWLCINTIRCLAADMVEKANSGHPGAPMGCAPIAHALFTRIMKFNPENPQWWNRDRFVLSNGHACALLYSMLHLTGYKQMTIDELKNFRQLHAKTPGHPERTVTEGVEVTTGPLGQGIANAVGLAIAQENLAANYSPDLFDNFTFVLCGDGCLQEGVSAEASSLAGHLGLGRLIVIYDDNRITIDGDTNLSFTENVAMRYAAYGWQVLQVEDGDNAFEEITESIKIACEDLSRPTIIRVRTTIGFGSLKAGSEKCHGAPLGPEILKQVKRDFDFDENEYFHIPEKVIEFFNGKKQEWKMQEEIWKEKLRKFQEENPEKFQELFNRFSGNFLANFNETIIPSKFEGDKATRSISGDILAHLMKTVPGLIGGSADLTESTLVNKANISAFSRKNRVDRYIHFGVREHAMVAAANGIEAYGAFIPFVSTFANFIGYCWGSLRLSALSHHKILFIATHDSIDLGEDGPTHQPIEILSLLRSTPNIIDFRPADGNETAGGYSLFLKDDKIKCPMVLVLNRSNIPQLRGSKFDLVKNGGYILEDFQEKFEVNNKKKFIVLAGSGSEVHLLIPARERLFNEHGIFSRIVSIPSFKLFELQTEEYKRNIFPVGIKALLVEASKISLNLKDGKFFDFSVEMKTFGESAPSMKVKDFFGFSVEKIFRKIVDEIVIS